MPSSTEMKSQTLLRIALASLLTCSSLTAQEAGAWRAASSNAKAITGDVALSGQRVSINFTTYPMAQIRALTPAELAATFDAEPGAPGTGNLYRVSIPADKRFLHKNTLCGSEDTQWLVTYASGRSLQLAFFSSSQMPALSAEALANSSNLCGTFSYVR